MRIPRIFFYRLRRVLNYDKFIAYILKIRYFSCLIILAERSYIKKIIREYIIIVQIEFENINNYSSNTISIILWR